MVKKFSRRGGKTDFVWRPSQTSVVQDGRSKHPSVKRSSVGKEPLGTGTASLSVKRCGPLPLIAPHGGSTTRAIGDGKKNLRRGQRVRFHGDDPPGFLRRATVKAATRKVYRDAMHDVEIFLQVKKRKAKTHDEWDQALNDYVEMLYLRGESPHKARLAIYGSAFWMDLASRSALIFPLAKKALLGFLKLDPEHARDPPPEEVVYLLSAALLQKGTRMALVAAVAIFVQFDTYLRPRSLLSLERRHVTLPRKGSPYRNVVLTLAPPGDAPLKNYLVDMSIIVGAFDRSFVAEFVAALARKTTRPDELLFPLTLPQYEKELGEACERTGLKAAGLKVTPHGIRHTGPSVDMYFKRCSLDDVRNRGLWMSNESVRRYGKPAALLRMIGKLSASQLGEAQRLRRTLPGKLRALLVDHRRPDHQPRLPPKPLHEDGKTGLVLKRELKMSTKIGRLASRILRPRLGKRT